MTAFEVGQGILNGYLPAVRSRYGYEWVVVGALGCESYRWLIY